jgi:hypothetical protein
MSDTIGNGFLPSDLAVDSTVSGDRTVTGNLTVLGTATMSKLTALSTFSDNAGALSGGLIVGDLYSTGADPDVICIVHAAP